MAADPTKLKATKNIGVPSAFFCAARVPGTSRLYCGSSDFKVYELDLAAEKPEPAPLKGEGHQSYVTGAALAGNQLVTGSYDQRLIWWDVEKKEQVRAVDAHGYWIRKVIAAPDGKVIASVADDMLAKLWDAETGKLLHTLNDHKPVTPHGYPSMLYAVAFSSDGKLLATGDKVGHIVIWETASGKKLAELEAPVMYTWDPRQRRHSIGGVRSVAFSRDSSLLAAGGIGTIDNIDHLGGPSRIELFDWKAGKRLHEISDDKFKGLIEQIEFHPGGEWFVAAGGDHNGFVSFYQTATAKLIHQDKAPMHVHAFAVNEDFDTLFAVGNERVAQFEFKAEEPKPAETAADEKKAG